VLARRSLNASKRYINMLEKHIAALRAEQATAT
jgi:hypothetical protein